MENERVNTETGEILDYDPRREAKSFTEVLRDIDRGRFLLEIEDDVRRVVEGAILSGKVGTVTIKLKFRQAAKDSNQMLVKGESTPSVPKPDRPITLFFTDDENNLLRRDPKQYELGLGPVKPKPIRREAGE